MQPPTSRFYTAESSLDTQAQLLPRQIADSTLRFRPFVSYRSLTDASSFSSSRWQTDLLQSLPCLSFGSLFTKAYRKQTQPSLVQPIAPSLRSQSHLSFPALASLGHSLSERWAGTRSERGRKEKNLSVHHHRTNNEQPPTPPDTHVTSNYRTTWLNMHLMGDLG